MKLLNAVNCAIFAAVLLFTACNTAETTIAEEPKADFTQVIPTLEAITADWNKGDLDKFVTVYDSAATFMLPKGPIGVSEMKGYYQEAFTETGTPTSTLSFDSLEMRPLGNSHALVTGRYILTNQDSTAQSGRYTLVFEHSNEGWKILHDHSN
ncbi:YybH family protein [Pontibacter anaerobius]|uniref:Nuclear transport factor 2 family protein n=1 Tax=Pontibacter anaerobius TaxID=2993940 RepID=A0ABT3RIF3_9BACT|nr:nuclear transport factor 2 family protein [Pontibacter anaerobius]MCX2741273.1 nuclear transport factor 2 family protein [Pontibacter anaerobius]